MKIRLSTVVSVITSLSCLALAAAEAKRSNDISKKLNISIDELSKKTPVDISEKVFNAAVQKSVDNEVRSQVSKTTSLIKKEIVDDMREKITSAIDDAYQDIHGKVDDRVAEELEKIDFPEMKKEIRKKIESRMLKELLDVAGIRNWFGRGSSPYYSDSRIDGSTLSNIIDSFDSDYSKLNALDKITRALSGH